MNPDREAQARIWELEIRVRELEEELGSEDDAESWVSLKRRVRELEALLRPALWEPRSLTAAELGRLRALVPAKEETADA